MRAVRARQSVGWTTRRFLTLKKQGLTILLVEQNTSRALQTADRVCILASGTMVYQGPAEEAAKNQGLFETYLGVSC